MIAQDCLRAQFSCDQVLKSVGAVHQSLPETSGNLKLYLRLEEYCSRYQYEGVVIRGDGRIETTWAWCTVNSDIVQDSSTAQ